MYHTRSFYVIVLPSVTLDELAVPISTMNAPVSSTSVILLATPSVSEAHAIFVPFYNRLSQ